MNMSLALVLTALFVLASAADESNENGFIGHMSNAITYESKRGAEELAAFWDQNQKTDQPSIEEFLRVLDVNVLVKVKVDLAGLVRNSLGKAVTKPESTDMYKVLQNIIKRYTNELTLGRARALTTNTKMKGNSPSEAGADSFSKSIANWYDGVAKTNVTKEELTQLLNKTQAQIDAYVKHSINADKKPSSKVSTRSGSFFFNQHLQEQQQKSSSSVAHKLANHMTSNMCSPQPSSYINNCHSSCQPYCSNCQPSYGQSNHYAGAHGHHSSYNHASSSSGSGASNIGGVAAGNLIGSGHHTSNGLVESINSGHHSSYNHASGTNFGDVGSGNLIGSGHHTSHGLVESINSGHHSSYNHASGSKFGDVGSSNLIGSGHHTSHGLVESINAGHHSSYNHASGTNFGGVGSGNLIGSGHHTSNGLVEGINAGHHSSYNHASGTNFGGVGSGSLIGSGMTGGNLGNYGNSHSFSGNAHNSHSSSFDASMSGSASSHIGHRNNQDISGTYSGIANLWSLNKPNGPSGISGSPHGSSDFSSSGLGSSSLYGESSHLGGDVYNSGNSFNHHAGVMSNMQGHGLGNYNSEHYSGSNSKSSHSSKSDSSASHSSYDKAGIW